MDTRVSIRWLGQSGFLLGLGSMNMLIDAWFSAHELREHPAPSIDALPERIDWLLATHEHADHLDLPALPALIERHHGLRVVVPAPLVARVAAFVPDARIIGVQPGDTLDGGEVLIRAVRAWHGVTIGDGYSDGRGPQHANPTPFCGYVVKGGGTVVLHAGDTIRGAEMVDELAPLAIEVALLPVNGRDAPREAAGVLGNLWPDEAVQLAAEIGARYLVPMHFDMVRGNTVGIDGLFLSAGGMAGAPIIVVPDRDRPLAFP
jgi:L-ascorbate 6-phosphate lactonase